MTALARDLLARQAELAVAAAVAREGVARAEAVAGLAPAPRPVRWGWRRSIRFAVEHRMLTPEYARLYARFLAARLRAPHVEFEGIAFLGRRVELEARRHHGRLRIGAWCWIGNGNRLRSHEGVVRLGAKAVLGSDNVVNSYLDVEIGDNALLGDWIYICDFDHRHDRVDVPIRKQGIAKSPVRIGSDVWIGEKVTILRGADIGAGSVVASQSLVKGAIPPFSIVAGTPARVVRSRLPRGMTAEEALDLQRAARPIPGDPIG